MESFSRPPPARGGDCADPGASRGHRKNNLLRSQDELFYGYYASTAAVTFAQVRFRNRPELPEVHHSASVAIPHRGMTAFIGLSGAGKTGCPR